MSLEVVDLSAVGLAQEVGTIVRISAGSHCCSIFPIEDIATWMPFGDSTEMSQPAQSDFNNCPKIHRDLDADNFSYCSLSSGIANS